MIIVAAIFSILLAFISAAYLQLPTFLLVLGYRWFHSYKIKRWFFRVFSLAVFAFFIYLNPPLLSVVLTSIPVCFFMIFSLVNANPKVYIALQEEDLLKVKDQINDDSSEVLGYTDKNGNAVCYPVLELVKPRHLLNDTFMKTPILISYCMACRSAMVFNPVVEKIRLHFEVVGVHRRNMVICDLETGTVWQQATGEAVYGRLTGKKLEYLPYQITTLKEWLMQHPDSFVVRESGSVRDGIFSKERLMKMMKVTESLIAPGLTNLSGLPVREKIWGIEVQGYSKAYPVSELLNAGDLFSDKIGNTEITVKYNKRSNFIEIRETITGKVLPAQSHWWFGWKEFHPETEIWKNSK